MKSRHEAFCREIFKFAVKRGARGITTDEMAVQFHTVPNCVSGRMTEMKQRGWLISTDKRRPTRRKCLANVWMANPDYKFLLKAWALTAARG